jgi:putative peptidoglycan lipid II flippase
MHARSLARAAVIVGIAYVLSNLTGLGQRIIVTSRFGTSLEYDAFNAAFRIPDLLFNLLAGGALASAFIPTFTARLSRNQQSLAWKLAGAVAGLVFVVLSVVALVAALLAPFLVRTIIAPGFSAEQVDLTAALMRIMLLSTLVFGVSGLLMGVLQSNGSFIAPAIAPSLYNIGIIIGATVFSAQGIYGVAVGVVLGALLHLAIQLPALAKVLYTSWRKSSQSPILPSTLGTNLQSPDPQSPESQSPIATLSLREDIRNVVRLMLPRVVGLGAVQVNLIVNVLLASRMGEGAVSALNIAFATMILPQAAIAQAIATVLFPTISAHAARGEFDRFANSLSRAVNTVIALSAPAAIGLILLGRPIIRLLFERNTFNAESTEMVSFALMWFAAGLVGHAALEVVTRGFYALHDTFRPVVLSVAAMIINVVLSLVLAEAFRARGFVPFGGLALANTIATALETVALYVLLAWRVPELSLRPTLIASLKSTLAAVAMALALWVWLRVLGDGNIAALLAIVLGIAVYFGVAWLLRSEEVRYGVGLVSAKFLRNRGANVEATHRT